MDDLEDGTQLAPCDLGGDAPVVFKVGDFVLGLFAECMVEDVVLVADDAHPRNRGPFEVGDAGGGLLYDPAVHRPADSSAPGC